MKYKLETSVLYYVEPFLGNDRESLSNSSTNKHVSTTMGYSNNRSGVFYAVRAEML
jgi:hypothetical protein